MHEEEQRRHRPDETGNDQGPDATGTPAAISAGEPPGKAEVERRYGIPESRHLEHARPCWLPTLMALLHGGDDSGGRKKPEP